jgi:hypothetical protein
MSLPSGPINLADPVNVAHSLNVGRVAWWLSLPGQANGPKLRDLFDKRPATLVSPIARPWNISTRPGGFSDVTLDGTAAYLDCGNNPALNPTSSDQTYAFWCRFNTAPSGSSDYWIIARDDDTLGRAYSIGVSGSSWAAQINGGATGTMFPQAAIGVWTHVVFTYLPGSNTWFFYQNGLQANTGAGAGNVAAATSSTTIGERTYAGFNGRAPISVDDVSIWNRALFGPEVYSLYTESLANYPETLNYLETPAYQAIGNVGSVVAVPGTTFFYYSLS